MKSGELVMRETAPVVKSDESAFRSWFDARHFLQEQLHPFGNSQVAAQIEQGNVIGAAGIFSEFGLRKEHSDPKLPELIEEFRAFISNNGEEALRHPDWLERAAMSFEMDQKDLESLLLDLAKKDLRSGSTSLAIKFSERFGWTADMVIDAASEGISAMVEKGAIPAATAIADAVGLPIEDRMQFHKLPFLERVYGMLEDPIIKEYRGSDPDRVKDVCKRLGVKRHELVSMLSWLLRFNNGYAIERAAEDYGLQADELKQFIPRLTEYIESRKGFGGSEVSWGTYASHVKELRGRVDRFPFDQADIDQAALDIVKGLLEEESVMHAGLVNDTFPQTEPENARKVKDAVMGKLEGFLRSNHLGGRYITGDDGAADILYHFHIAKDDPDLLEIFSRLNAIGSLADDSLHRKE